MAHSFAKRIKGTTPYYNLAGRIAFPSTRSIAITSLVLTTVGVGLSFLIVERTASSFLIGAISGIGILAVPMFVSDLVLYFGFMKEDPLFFLRRCFASSLATITIWVLVFLFGAILSLALPRFAFPAVAVILGLYATIPIRALAIYSMSRLSFLKRSVFTLTGPTLTGLAVIVVVGMSAARIVTALLLASMAGLAFAFTMISVIERYGRRAIGFSPIRMFRAFLTDWLEGRSDEIESYLNELGVETELDTAAFVFRRKSTASVKGIMLVSNFHPGPFLNVGSSVLPYLFQSVVNRRLNAVGLVPHGVSGHELNLVSKEQTARVIEWVLVNMGNAHYDGNATPVTRTRNEIATATSQAFDGCALVTMTTSPYDMEDVPTEVTNRLFGLTHGKFRHVALVDAHNSLTGPATMTPEKVGALEDAALASIQVTAEQSPTSFKVGVAHRHPSGFTLKDGIGAGGISVIASEVNGQRFAYINMDGNNMIQGFREEILDAAGALGFDDGEVMTTDTHMVNGIVHARLGYHPIGEVGSRNALLNDVTETCREAMATLEPCDVGVIAGQIPVTTLGSKSLRGVMNLVYRVSKWTIVALFLMVAAMATLSLLFLV